MHVFPTSFPTYSRLCEAVEASANGGAAPKSVACGTAVKLDLNRELIHLLDIADATDETVIRTLDMGYGPMDLYADTTLPADAMELRDEPCGARCQG